MFYTFKDKTQVHAMQNEIEFLKSDVKNLMRKLEIQTIRIDVLMKAYPHGTTRTGEPRKKPGRKAKVEI